MLVSVATCGKDKEVTDYFSQVAAATEDLVTGVKYVIGTHRTGQAQLGDPVQRIAVYPLGGTYLPGGSTPIRIGPSGHGHGPNAEVKVSGADGYFVLQGIDSGDAINTLVVTISQNAPSAFVLQMAAYYPSSDKPTHGGFYDLPIQLTEVGTGDIQVNVSWDRDSAVDLHVVEPSGDEIHYANKGPSATGGQLDLGSEANCSSDRLRSENIFWPTGRAARGSYTVRLHYRLACTESPTKYVVTVNVRGHQPQIFYGSFVLADIDRTGVGRTITTFAY